MWSLITLPFRLVWSVLEVVWNVVWGAVSLAFGLVGGILSLALGIAVLALVAGLIVHVVRQRSATHSGCTTHPHDEDFISFYDKDAVR